MDKIKI